MSEERSKTPPAPAQFQAVRIKATVPLQHFLWDKLQAKDANGSSIWTSTQSGALITEKALTQARDVVAQHERTVQANPGLQLKPAQALNVLAKYATALGAEHQWKGPSGLRWRRVGATRPTTGRERTNEKLAEALAKGTEFTKEQWDAFRLLDLRVEDFVQAGGAFFKPDATPKEATWEALRGGGSALLHTAVRQPAPGHDQNAKPLMVVAKHKWQRGTARAPNHDPLGLLCAYVTAWVEHREPYILALAVGYSADTKLYTVWDPEPEAGNPSFYELPPKHLARYPQRRQVKAALSGRRARTRPARPGGRREPRHRRSPCPAPPPSQPPLHPIP